MWRRHAADALVWRANRLTFRTSLKRGRAHERPETAKTRHRLRRGMSVVLYRQAPDRECAGAGAGYSGRGALAAVLPQFMGAARGHRPRRISHREIRFGRG